MEWQNGILGFIPEKDWLEVPFNPERPNSPIANLIANEKTSNIIASYQDIAAEYLIPSMAQFHAYDTEAKTSVRYPIDTYNVEKGLIKAKLNQSERFRQYMQSGVIHESEQYDYVMKDGIRLGEEVITRTVVANYELLATGQVTIKENNLDITVDYGVKSTQTNFTLDLSTSADVIAQIENIVETAKKSGVTLTGMLLATSTLTKMRRNSTLQTAIKGTNGVGTTLRKTELESFFSDEFSINNIITTDELYNVNKGIGTDGRPIVTPVRYYPEDKVTFFARTPGGKILTGLWGDPPEVTNKLMKTTSASGVSPYVYISQYTENDPAVLWTKASALYIPVLLNPSSLYIATVTEGTVTDGAVTEDGA